MTNRSLVLLGLFLLPIGLFAQDNSQKTPRSYLILKVSDQSVEDNGARLNEFLLVNYNLGSQINTLTYEFPDIAYRLTDGWLFSKYAGMEGELIYYDEYKVDITTTDGEEIRLSRQSYAASFSLFGQYPILKNLNIYGKGGFSYWRTDTKVRRGPANFPDKIHDDKVDPIFGAGLRLSISSDFLVDLSLEKTEVDGVDMDTISLGFGFRY